MRISSTCVYNKIHDRCVHPSMTEAIWWLCALKQPVLDDELSSCESAVMIHFSQDVFKRAGKSLGRSFLSDKSITYLNRRDDGYEKRDE